MTEQASSGLVPKRKTPSGRSAQRAQRGGVGRPNRSRRRGSTHHMTWRSTICHSNQFAPAKSGHRQKFLNRSGASSVYLTVCWTFLCPR